MVVGVGWGAEEKCQPLCLADDDTDGKGYIFGFPSYFNFTPKNLGSRQNLGH